MGENRSTVQRIGLGYFLFWLLLLLVAAASFWFTSRIAGTLGLSAPAQAQLMAGLRLYWLVAAIVTAAGAVLLAQYTTRMVLRPVRELLEQAKRIAQRDALPPQPLPQEDALGELSHSLVAAAAEVREAYTELEERVGERTRALETIVDISRNLATILEPEPLIREIVEQVRFAFDYYYVQIYLLDEEQGVLNLAAATGPGGRQLLAAGHKLESGRGTVGLAAQRNRPVLIPNVTVSRDWLPNPALPATRAELAVPIAFGAQVLGVLDVQHNVVNGLDERDLALLQSMANQVAIALQNARLFAQIQRRAQREERINVISQQIQQADSVEGVLQVTAEQLGRSLHGRRTSVYLSRSLPETSGR